MRFVIVTGMSGAGKATALKTLEDAGFFCVDNLPIQLIKRFAEIAYDEQIQVDDVAISVDIRSGRALSQLNSCLADIRREGMNYEILFRFPSRAQWLGAGQCPWRGNISSRRSASLPVQCRWFPACTPRRWLPAAL